MRGGGDGWLSFACVPCPLLPFFLVILLPLLPLPPAAQLQVVGLGRQVLLVGGSRLVGGIDRQGGASLGRLSWVVASLRPWSCSRPWARSRALLLPPCTIHQHLTSSSKSCNYALNLLFLYENDKFSSASLLFASQVAMVGVSEMGKRSGC